MWSFRKLPVSKILLELKVGQERIILLVEVAFSDKAKVLSSNNVPAPLIMGRDTKKEVRCFWYWRKQTN